MCSHSWRCVMKNICKKCKCEYEPLYRNGVKLSNFCISCLVEKGKQKSKSIARKEKINALEHLKTHKDYLKDLQKVFNQFIRLRDANKPCVSCGVVKCEEFHAGHYIATTHQFLRFNEMNVHRQCSYCNTHLRGNLIPYRIELIKRIGIENVEWLEENRNNTLKLSIPEIKEKIIEYKNKIKNYCN